MNIRVLITVHAFIPLFVIYNFYKCTFINGQKFRWSVSMALDESTFLQILIHSFLGTCTELPLGSNLLTDTHFPVKKGTVVYVNCVPGYVFTDGDRALTCVSDSEFTYERAFPTCTIGMLTS